MPFTINGFGTSVCGSRGDIGWGSQDAMEWFVALQMPLIPLKAMHTFDWNRNQFRAIPITWSLDLTIRTFLGRWVWGMVLFGGLLLLSAIFEIANQRSLGLGYLLGAMPLLGLAITLILALRWTDARNKAIRRVLGGNTIGNCDPAHLPVDVLERMAGDPQVAFGATAFAEAARDYLHRRSYARAMWVARVCVVLEDRAEGGAITDMILQDPEVSAALEEIRRDARRWAPLMFVDEAQPAPVSSRRPVDVLPVETDDRIRPG